MPSKKVIWKSIPEYEGLYEASSDGQIRNTRTGKIIKPHKTHDGYPRLTLYKPGEPKRLYTVHVIVAATFLGPRPEGMHIDHKDGNKDNPAASNLEYVTARINQERAAKLGLKARGSRQHCAQLTEQNVIDIRKRHATGERIDVLSMEFGVTYQAVWLVVKRKNWAWIA